VSPPGDSCSRSTNQHDPETDELFPAPKRHETEALLKDMDIPYQITLYSDVDHGFALKADLSKPRIKFATESAFLQAVNWFNEFLKTK
jgi:dienelactone hydrolase